MLKANIKTSLTTTREFDINEEWLVYDVHRMQCSSITGFAYGNTFVDQRFTKIITHHFKIEDRTGKRIEIAFNDVINTNSQQTADAMSDAMWKCFGNRIMNEMIATISKGEEVLLGGVRFSKNGFSHTYKPWFRKEKTVTSGWDDMTYERMKHFDMLELKSLATGKTLAVMGLVGVLNAHVLMAILEHKKRDPQLLDYLTGKKVYLQS
jgi:hypothetical protein